MILVSFNEYNNREIPRSLSIANNMDVDAKYSDTPSV